jgi:glycosyltransferase involved in cell wall biosynthesis
MTTRLSVCIITLNERANLERCLRSLRPMPAQIELSEIVVVDAESSDGTAELARELGAQVYTRQWPGYGAQRNFGLAQCHGDWVLVLDADEETTPALLAEIGRALSDVPPTVGGFRIPRRTFFLGKWIRSCGWWPVPQLRLLRKDARYDDAPIHESALVSGELRELREPMNHYSYASLTQYVEKMNRYSSLTVETLSESHRRRCRSRMLTVPVKTFLKMFVVEQGFREGWHGFVLSSLTACSMFCVYAKAWESELARISGHAHAQFEVSRK